MSPIEFGLELFKKASELQTKKIRATEIIARASEAAENMPEPFKSNLGVIITHLVDECENVAGG